MSAVSNQSFLFGFLFFLGLVLLQLLWWRLRTRFTICWMFATFLVIPLAVLFTTQEWAGSILLLSLSLSYLFGFPAVVAQSPSLEILKRVHRHTPQGGIASEAILETLAKTDLIEDRIKDLTADGMVAQEGGQIKIRLFGRWVGMVFYYYRKMLSLPAGKG